MALLGGALTLPGCASLDRWVLGDESESTHRVVILGAGLAGLQAAYLLKKNQIPFLLIEAAPRVGGRVYSLTDFNSASQVAELGGEWILPHHEAILQLCKELRLELTERNWGHKDFALVLDGKIQDRKKIEVEFKKALQLLKQKQSEVYGRGALRLSAFNHEQLPQAKKMDQGTALEYLKSLRSHISAEVVALLLQSLEVQMGAGAQKLSALAVFQLINGIGAHFPGVEKAYRIGTGGASLAGALADRVAGVIPGHRLILNSALSEIDVNKNIFSLKIQGPEGSKTVLAKDVICTLPLTVLRQIRGFYKISFNEAMTKAIQKTQYGTLTKGAIGFSDRVWKKTQDITRWWNPGSGLVFMESEPRTDRSAMTPQSVLSFQLGGDGGASGGLQTIDAAAGDLAWLKLAKDSMGSAQVYNWGRAKYAQGGTSYWEPGFATELGGVLSQSASNWVLAGEHTNLLYQGTMNGAVESATDAVRQVLQNRTKNSGIFS